MSNDRNLGRDSQRPRAEPEIIPPGRDGASHEPDQIWMRVGDGYGVHRVYVGRPGPFSIVLGLLVVGAILAVAFLVVAGVALLWLPILIGGILLALLTASVRYRWRRLQDWLAGGR